MFCFAARNIVFFFLLQEISLATICGTYQSMRYVRGFVDMPVRYVKSRCTYYGPTSHFNMILSCSVMFVFIFVSLFLLCTNVLFI